MSARWFPIEVTPEEAQFGFVIVDSPAGNRRVAVATIGPRLRAVKVVGHAGKCQYLICNEHLAPLRAIAKSLDELRSRYPRK